MVTYIFTERFTAELAFGWFELGITIQSGAPASSQYNVPLHTKFDRNMEGSVARTTYFTVSQPRIHMEIKIYNIKKHKEYFGRLRRPLNTLTFLHK